MTSARFPRSARVRAKPDFDRIFQHGRRTALPVLALHWLSGDVPARLGLAVSRKVDKKAVGRNRIKRVLRDTFRHLRGQLAAGDFVVVARPPAGQASNPELVAAFQGLLQRSGALAPPAALPLSPATGTMPAASPSAPTPHVERG